MELVVASTNLHKVREIRDMLGKMAGLELLSLAHFPHYQQPEEDGETCEANATLKAVHAAQELGKWVIADDSGLYVPALGGEPGVRSARYAGVGASERDNRLKLLNAMKGFEGLQRAAYFECWIALASPAGLERIVCGKCEGEILEEERGRNGFCYDLVFRKHGYSMTFGELPEETKNRVSHRFRAIEKIRPAIEALV
jgi:XTP/dITP diphosphohydrolase